jgi:uncharacterized membrane protein
VKPGFNPFYGLLLVVGVAFAFTACCYGVLMVTLLQPERATRVYDQGTGLLGWLDRYGMWLLGAELALLAIFTFAALATDDYWTRSADKPSAKHKPSDGPPE